MNSWKFFFIMLIAFIFVAALLGYALLILVDFTHKAFKSKNKKRQWIALSFIAGFYLALKGWFFP